MDFDLEKLGIIQTPEQSNQANKQIWKENLNSGFVAIKINLWSKTWNNWYMKKEFYAFAARPNWIDRVASVRKVFDCDSFEQRMLLFSSQET